MVCDSKTSGEWKGDSMRNKKMEKPGGDGAVCCHDRDPGRLRGHRRRGKSSVDMSEAGGKNTIVVLNYGEYIDTSVLKQFQKETGIKVLYEEATTPEEMYSKYKASTIPYDLICSSDYMVERLDRRKARQKRLISARCSTSIISETCIGRCQNHMIRNSSTVSRIFGEQ